MKIVISIKNLLKSFGYSHFFKSHYKRKEPDGKGGFNYIYDEPVAKQKKVISETDKQSKELAKKEYEQKNSWWQDLKKHELNAYPVNIPKKDVEIDLKGDINSHAVLSWKDPKSGKKKQAYTKEFLDRNQKVKFQRISNISTKEISNIRENSLSLLSNADKDLQQIGAIIAIISHTGLRPGDKTHFLHSGNRGVSTLSPDNFSIEGYNVSLKFKGKSYKENNAVIKSKELADYLTALIRDKKGSEFIFDVPKNKIEKGFHENIGAKKGIKLKDLRTYFAGELSLKLLKNDNFIIPKGDEIKQQKAIQNYLSTIYKRVSVQLNNSPAMARDNYIDPYIINNWLNKKQNGK